MKHKKEKQVLKYKKGNIFSNRDPNKLIVHACNCRGVWGAGIAKQAAQVFPATYARYKLICQVYDKRLVGRAIIIENQGQRVGCLFTSYDFGNKKDSEDKILEYTEKAVDELLRMAHAANPYGIEIHSPKINSGLFGVPWEKTENIIKKALTKYNELSIIWTIWEL